MRRIPSLFNRLSLTVTLVFLSLLLSTPALGAMLSINGDMVNIRSGPGKNYRVKYKYGRGFPLKVVSRKGQWVKVQDFENDTGWVHRDLLKKKGHMVVKVFRNKNKKINIRSGPGTNYRIVGRAYYGVVFSTVKQQRGWVQVRHNSGLQGWVKRSLVWGF